MPLAVRTACAQLTEPMKRLHSLQTNRFPAWLGLILAGVLLAAVLPQDALGQADDIDALIERGEQAGVDADQMRTVADRARGAGLEAEAVLDLLRPAVDLAERDLPATPLLNKTLEGMAKNVPLSRMRPVLQQVQGLTEQAGELTSRWTQRAEVRELLGISDDTPGEGEARGRLVTAITEAQQQNVPAEHIEEFLDALPASTERRPVPPSDVAVAVSVLPDLPGHQSAPGATRELLTAALDAGYSGESLRQLPAALESARRESQRPPEAFARGAAQAIAQGVPAANVLQNLFQGSLPPGEGPPGEVGDGPPGDVPGFDKPPGKDGRPPGIDPPVDPPGGGPPGSGGE